MNFKTTYTNQLNLRIMGRFYFEQLTPPNLKNDNTIVYLRECLQLIDDSEYKDELIEAFEFETIKDKSLKISGLKTLIQKIIDYDKVYLKIDLESHVSNVKYLKPAESGAVILQIDNINSELIAGNSIQVETAYNAKKDFFDGFYKMDKFANFCIKENLSDIIIENIDYLNQKYSKSTKFVKSYRLLKNDENKYFVRAITSISRYFDYNIKFSLFATLVSLYKTIEEIKDNFSINYCEFTESFIRIYFKRNTTIQLPNIGTLSFSIEMNNDEIKREAFKFSGIFTITTMDKDREVNVHIKPKKKFKTQLISIPHGCGRPKMVENLSNLPNFITEMEVEMRKDLIDISNITKPDHLRFFLIRKIESSRNEEFKRYKASIINTLNKKINQISELFILMDKVNEIVIEFELKEYLRYIYYDVLSEKNQQTGNQQ